MTTAASPMTAVPGPRGRRHRYRLWLWLAVLVLVAGLSVAAYTASTLAVTYSTGERTGYVQKLSRKGWVCPTYEGELAMTTMPGTAPEIFRFTVRDERVAHAIEQASGSQVVLDYDQHIGVPTSCFGETEYYVTGVRKAGQ